MARTWHFGEPTEEEKDIYTRVLLGTLAVARIRWKKEKIINADQLYLLAKSQLNFLGLDIPHKLGHGVNLYGSYQEWFP